MKLDVNPKLNALIGGEGFHANRRHVETAGLYIDVNDDNVVIEANDDEPTEAVGTVAAIIIDREDVPAVIEQLQTAIQEEPEDD